MVGRPEKTFFQRRYTDSQQAQDKMLNMANHQRYANQKHNDITSHLSEWPSSKSLQTKNVDKHVEKRKPCYTVGGNVHCCSHYRQQYGDSLKN